MSYQNNEAKPQDIIPDIVVNPSNNQQYTKGQFFGKGGFAKCYELIDCNTKQIYAGKIVPKRLLANAHQKSKMSQEIAIHSTIQHNHIVTFYSFFEDENNVYILLELCRRRSLMELHKRRKTVTEPEARYFLRQLITACDYLHDKHIIHRDLKLGNLFLNDDMELKIGDFGLATKVDFNGERKKTLCGTPNYIAPEVLGKKGHSYEVDAWSIGCILYTLLLGKPPFETSNLKDTYSRIKKNQYNIPPGKISNSAHDLIRRLLQAEPNLRPTMKEVLNHDFLTAGLLPHSLPTSCLSTIPRLDLLKPADFVRKPLGELIENNPTQTVNTNKEYKIPIDASLTMSYLHDLSNNLASLVNSLKFDVAFANDEDAEDPAAIPIFWVSKWVDYSDKYGLGYQLCDNSIGVLFNDSSRILLTTGENMQYIEKDGVEYFYTLKAYPENLLKKVTLLKYFRNYMNDHLLKAGANIKPRESDGMVRLPFLQTWFRTRSAIVLYLSNGTLQVNFFQDHTKIILCPLMGAVTYIDEKRSVRTYRFRLLEKHGCSKELATRLKYAKTMSEKIIASNMKFKPT